MSFSGCTLKRKDGVNVPLVNGKQIIGRSRETMIKDVRCSKKQVECDVDLSSGTVLVRTLGANPSSALGRPLPQGQSVSLRHGDSLELLSGQHQFTVHFLPPPTAASGSSTAHQDSPSGLKRAAGSVEAPSPKRARPDSAPATGLDEEGLGEQSDGEEQETLAEQWTSLENDQLLMFVTKGVKPSSKIAAFDLDGTIITTKSGKTFAKDRDDWQIIYPDVPRKLKELSKSGFKIVFLTNQLGISKRKLLPEDLRRKLQNITGRLGVPVQCLISPGDRWYRKPRPGMWEYLIKTENGSRAVDMKESFYCGDAAGRREGWAPKKKKDFSCSDRLFAINVGLRFYTPEELFLGQPATNKYQLPEFDPRAAVDGARTAAPVSAARTEKEIAVLVGPPGSGKSHVTSTQLVPAGYVAANRDTLKSWQKCVQVAEQAIKEGKSAAVDNTNGDRESRARYVQLGRRLGVPVRCLLMTTTLAHARHNNKYRELTDSSHQHVSDMIFNMFKSRYEEPTTDEGFSEICRLDCLPTFSDQQQERIYRLYLLEK
ncbi:bifunctional polynucleotide phosphatase/kinase-like [Amphibalanus amphitrite]|uniref:bifunctional polynucleotide phosphatase/kinase-like n=1 Tax=Amphibalanus amphitrite TaxID=1232801 RepID=UPI001C91F06E|nr:bifunctional polynucleotide phosphatase/kinase-like [Amphibalanus amphitrite]XP_043197808.1 bifunctional polynucleotide phosphatase/kinase-like [Amphibalanus amphitrite]